jgi:ABC-type multidrug transport system fused ATPase/permease subunit
MIMASENATDNANANANASSTQFEFELFVPGLQRTSALLSFVVSVIMFLMGSALLFFPAPLARTFFQETTVLQPLDRTLSRMAGAGLLAQALSCFILLLPMIMMYHHDHDDWSVPPTKVSVDKCRTAIGLQSVLSLLFVICGLLDDRLGESGSRQSFWLLALGFGILIISCIGLMLSFWPVLVLELQDEEHEAPANGRAGHAATVERYAVDAVDAVDGNEDTEPLLPTSSEEAANAAANANDDEQASYRLLLEEPPSSEPAVNVEEEEQAVNSNSEPTSRIRGTRRLLKLAKPEVFYLYVGCATLLVRLPFSLSIPHLVSTTLGCVARGDFSGARREILLLFILGSIDACLDFWCIFLFGYANQRIVRGVRIDTFQSILKQDMGFFDKHTSGELASRLNSDCGEMAGGTVKGAYLYYTTLLGGRVEQLALLLFHSLVALFLSSIIILADLTWFFRFR